MSGVLCNFWPLLRLSGALSSGREAEAVAYPSLYRAKLLLRETIFYDLQQPDPSIHTETASSIPHVLFDDADVYGRFRLLYDCMMQFLQSFENQTMRQGLNDTRDWLAILLSLCIFSIVRTLLVDRASHPHAQSPSQPGPGVMHAVYKALVSAFISSSPALLDGTEPELGSELLASLRLH